MKDSTKIVFGILLRKHRLQRKLSQERLAELADLDRTYVSQIERGLKSPSIQTLLSLSHALHVKAYVLVSELEEGLTDRIGNFSELQPYFPLWQSLSVVIKKGVLEIIAIEQDETRLDVPRITKGTDGRALI